MSRPPRRLVRQALIGIFVVLAVLIMVGVFLNVVELALNGPGRGE